MNIIPETNQNTAKKASRPTAKEIAEWLKQKSQSEISEIFRSTNIFPHNWNR
jgi:hypothetical protein